MSVPAHDMPPLTQEMQAMLEPEEEVVWVGLPVKKVYIAYHLVTLPFGICFGGAGLVMAYLTMLAGDICGMIFALVFVCAGVAIGFGPFITSTLDYSKVQYVLTDERLIMHSGFIGRDFDQVDVDAIVDIQASVDLVDKLLGSAQTTGSIMATTAGTGGVSLLAIPDVYAVQKVLKKKVKELKGLVQTVRIEGGIPTAAVVQPVPEKEVEERLEELKELWEKEYISNEEYEEKRHEILKDL